MPLLFAFKRFVEYKIIIIRILRYIKLVQEEFNANIKKKYFFVLFSSLIIALTCLTQITDAQFSTKENIAKLNKIKKSTDFNLLLPSEDISKEWVLEIKNPENESNKVNFVHLNYLDKTDTFLKVSITETKAKMISKN
ncbi:hypothetical protein GTW56_30295 [Bacillus sp. EB93]|nr:hypothetical protein [Peribacillus frigoritolerans]